MDVPDVGRVTYTHDPARQLTRLKNGHNEVTTLVYDDAGRTTESKLSNGTKTSFTYDAANQTKGLVNVNSTNTTLSYYNYQFDGVGDRTSLWDNGVDVSNWNYDCTGQLTNDTSRPAATALNWNGLTIDQWNVLSVSGWDNLLVDHVPTGGAGMLEYSPTGNRLTQTDPVTGDVTTFTYDNANRLLTAVDEGSRTRTQWNGTRTRFLIRSDFGERMGCRESQRSDAEVQYRRGGRQKASTSTSTAMLSTSTKDDSSSRIQRPFGIRILSV